MKGEPKFWAHGEEGIAAGAVRLKLAAMRNTLASSCSRDHERVIDANLARFERKLERRQCARCGETWSVSSPALLCCDGCGGPRYCDAVCQTTHWLADHQYECAVAVEHDPPGFDRGLEDQAPDEFVDPLVGGLMMSLVLLPSGNVLDDATLQRHLLYKMSDPFTCPAQPLSQEEIVPLPELRQRVAAWLAEKRVSRRRRAAAAHGASWRDVWVPGA